jgi:hypothetical protein
MARSRIQELQDSLVAAMAADLQRYKANLDWLADGFWVEDPEKGRIYHRPPDRAANIYLIDRVLGKPTEKHEHTGQDGDPLFARERTISTLNDPELLALACELDRRLAQTDGTNSGGIREAGEPGPLGVPGSPGVTESETLRSGSGSNEAAHGEHATETREV